MIRAAHTARTAVLGLFVALLVALPSAAMSGQFYGGADGGAAVAADTYANCVSTSGMCVSTDGPLWTVDGAPYLPGYGVVDGAASGWTEGAAFTAPSVLNTAGGVVSIYQVTPTPEYAKKSAANTNFRVEFLFEVGGVDAGTTATDLNVGVFEAATGKTLMVTVKPGAHWDYYYIHRITSPVTSAGQTVITSSDRWFSGSSRSWVAFDCDGTNVSTEVSVDGQHWEKMVADQTYAARFTTRPDSFFIGTANAGASVTAPAMIGLLSAKETALP